MSGKDGIEMKETGIGLEVPSDDNSSAGTPAPPMLASTAPPPESPKLPRPAPKRPPPIAPLPTGVNDTPNGNGAAPRSDTVSVESPATAQGGDDNVINVYEDQPPVPPQAAISKMTALILMGMISGLILIPFVFQKTSRWVDLMAIFCLVPAAAAFAWAHFPKQRAVCAPENLVAKFAFGWLVLLPVAFVGALMAIGVGLFLIFFILGLLRLSEHVWVANLAFSVTVCGSIVLVEEFVKWLVVAKRDTFSSVENPKQFVMYSVFSALGMATGESYFLSLFIRRLYDLIAVIDARRATQEMYTPSPYSGGDWEDATAPQRISLVPAPTIPPDLAGADDVIIIVCLCVLVFIPMHVLAGYQLGLGVAKRHVLKLNLAAYKIILAPIVFRFIFMYMVMFLPIWVEYDWVSFSALIVVPIYILFVKWDERQMPNSYLRRAGYLTAFGYGAIPNEDEDELPGGDNVISPPGSPDFERHNDPHVA